MSRRSNSPRLKSLNYNSELVEIKGFKTEEWEAKLKFNQDVKVLYKEDLDYVFKYVKSTYGKNFLDMYE